MTTTTPTTTPRRVRTSGRTFTVGHFDLPSVSDATEPLLPAPIREARSRWLDLVAKQAEAIRKAADAQAAVTVAEQADAQALGDALLSGKTDPGGHAARDARAELEDARRVLAGTEQALNQAAHEYHRVVGVTDRTEAAEAVHELADQAAAAVPDALRTIAAAFTEVRSLRALANTLAVFPEVPVAPAVDPQDLTRALAMIETMFRTIAQDPSVVTIRTASESGFAA